MKFQNWGFENYTDCRSVCHNFSLLKMRLYVKGMLHSLDYTALCETNKLSYPF